MKLARFGQAGNENSFGGVDEHGRETCESGTCLPGFEEVRSPAGADDSIGNSCKPCPEGSQSSDGSPCSLCLPGTAAVASSAVCQRCEAGRFSATFGNSECGACEAGTFAAAGSHTCTTCPPGSFSTSGSVNCTWCPAGFVANDWGSLNCMACSAGTYAVAGGQRCNTCPDNAISDLASTHCKPCVGTYLVAYADPGRLTCQVSLLNLAFAGSFFICLLVVLNLLAFLCYQLLIEDFSLQNGKMVLTLCRPHRVLRWQANEPFVTLSSTGTPPLENLAKGCSYRAKALTGRDLHLIHPEGKVGPWDTSIGFCRVGFLSALLHTGYLRLPSIFWLLLWFAAGAAFARQLLGRMIIICLLLALVSTLLLQLWYRWMTRWSPLALKRDRFLRENLASPGLERVDSGPQRAVSMRQVSDLFTFFQSFIRDRSMYYISSNLVQPLTKRSQSSYAELAGPSRGSWFISHYWGTPFRQTVDAICHHAKQQGAVDWQSTTYWICTFANNQWQAQNWSFTTLYNSCIHNSRTRISHFPTLDVCETCVTWLCITMSSPHYLLHMSKAWIPLLLA